MCNSRWQNCSTVVSTIVQSLARLFNSRWIGYSTVAGTIVQQSLAWLFNSHWHNYSTMAGTIVQQSLARLFNSHWHDYSTVAGTIFSFFYAGRILQQWLARFFLFFMLAEFFNSDVKHLEYDRNRNMTHLFPPITFQAPATFTGMIWSIKVTCSSCLSGYCHHLLVCAHRTSSGCSSKKWIASTCCLHIAKYHFHPSLWSQIAIQVS